MRDVNFLKKDVDDLKRDVSLNEIQQLLELLQD